MSPPRGHRSLAPDARADGQPPTQPLAKTDDVGDDSRLDAGQQGSASTEAGPDLVADEQRAGAVAGRSQGRQKRRRRHDAPSPPEDRFDQNGADVSLRERLFHGRHRRVERPFVARVRRERDVGVELLDERLAEGRAQPARRERAVRKPVVRPVERDDAGTPGREDGGLERRRDRVRATGAEHHARAGTGVELGQALAEHELCVGPVHVAEREPETIALLVDGRRGARGPVAQEERAEAGGEVDVQVAVHVDDVRALTVPVNDRRMILAALGRPALPARLGRRTLDGSQPRGERERMRPGRSHSNIRQRLTWAGHRPERRALPRHAQASTRLRPARFAS